MNTFIWQQTLGVIISGQSEECPKIAHRNHKWLVISFFVFIWFSLTKCHLYQDYGSILFMTFCQLNTCHLKKIPSFSILISSKIANVDIPETPCPLKLAHIDILFVVPMRFTDLCPVRDIKNRILQSSNFPILEFKVLQNAFKIKKMRLKIFLK